MRLLLAFVLIASVVFCVCTINVMADETEDADRLKDIERDAEYFDKAQASFQSGKYKTARRYYKKVVRNEDEKLLTPQEYAQARINLALVYQYLGEKEDALALFIEKIDLDKLVDLDLEKNAMLINGYVNTSKYYGDLDNAEKLADTLVTKIDYNEIYLETAGEIAYIRGNYDKARKYFDKVTKLITDHKEMLSNYDKNVGDRNISNIYVAGCKSWYYLEKIDRVSHLKNAFEMARNAIKADKYNVEAHYWGGLITFETETQADTRNLYLDVARKINDQHPGIAHLMMRTYIFEKEYRKAQTEVDSLMQYLPDAEESLLAKIEMSNAVQDYAEAGKFIDKLLEINPKHLYGLSLKAMNCIQIGDLKGFENTEKKALTVNLSYSDFYMHVVKGLNASYQFDKAIELGEKGLKLEKNNWELQKWLGFAHAWQGVDEKRAYELLKSANLNDTLRNKLYTLNIAQCLKVLEEEFKTETSRDGNFVIKLHESAFEVMYPYIEDALMSDFKDLTTKYGFKLKTPIVVEGFHRMDDFGTRTIGLPAITVFGESFGRLITMALPQASERVPFSWRRVIRRELEKTFQIQMSKGCVPQSFLEGSSQYLLTQFRSTWQLPYQFNIVRSYYSNSLQKIADINLDVLDKNTKSYAIYQASLMVELLVEKSGDDKVLKQLIDLFAQNLSLVQAATKITGFNEEQIDEEFRNYVKSKFVDRVKVVAKPGMLELQKLISQYENSNDPKIKPQLAWAYFCNGMKKEAITLADEIFKEDENNKIAAYIKGMQTLEIAGDNMIMQSEAIDLLAKAANNGFEDYELYVLLGRLYEQDAPSKALEYYKKAVNAFPDFIGGGSAYMNLMQILAANNDNFQMFQYAEQMCKYTELQPGLRIMLAKQSITMNDSVSIAYWLRDVVEMIPQINDIPNNITEIHNIYAQACEEASLWHQMGLELRICITFEKLDKMKAVMYMKSASAYHKSKEFDIALEMIAKSIELNDTKEARDLKLSIELAKAEAEKK